MKISNEKIEHWVKVYQDALSKHGPNDTGAEILSMIKEVQQYREALRFKSFGELPPSVGDENVKIEVKHNDGIVYRADWWRNTSEVNHGKALSRDGLTKQGYIGWRYPIGDLLAEDK